MRRLIPDPGPTTLEQELAGYRPFDHAHDERPWVGMNMISTLDGRASVGGDTKGLGSEADTRHLLELRTRFDAILIGGGTLRAERYGRIISSPERRRRREEDGLPADALAVIVSGDLDLPFDAPIFTDGNGEVLIFTHKDEAPETKTPVTLVTSGHRIEMGELLRRLRLEYGVRSVLCEGGPKVAGQLAAGDLVDEFFLTLTPYLIGGDAPHIVEANLPERKGFELTGLLEGDGDLFLRYRQA